MRILFASLVLMSASLLGMGQETDKEARQIIEKTVAALGGKERAKNHNSYRAVLKGKAFSDERAIPFERELWVGGKDRSKSILRMAPSGQDRILIEVTNGDKSWRKFDDKLVDIPKEELKRDDITADSLQSFSDLLDSADVKFAIIASEKNAKSPTVTVRISKKGKADISVLVDCETLLPKRTITNPNRGRHKGKTVETRLEAFQEAGDVKYVFKTTLVVNGKKFAETEITKFEILKNIDPSVFEKP